MIKNVKMGLKCGVCDILATHVIRQGYKVIKTIISAIDGSEIHDWGTGYSEDFPLCHGCYISQKEDIYHDSAFQ